MIGQTAWSQKCAGWRLSLLGALVLWLLTVPAVAPADSWDPPPPDPDKPVNYIAWANETAGGRVRDNAYHAYLAAFANLKRGATNIRFGETVTERWSGNREVSDWLAANRGAMARFREAAARRECYVPMKERPLTGDPKRDHLLVEIDIPPLKAFEVTASGLLADGYRAWQQGDQELLPNNALLVTQCAHHLDSRGAGFLQHLTAAKIAYLGRVALCKALAWTDDPDALALRVLPELQRADCALQSFGGVSRFERLSSWDQCQRIFIRNGQGGGWDVDESLVKTMVGYIPHSKIRPSLLSRRLRSVGYDSTLRDLNSYYDALDEWSATPYHDAVRQKAQLARRHAQSPNAFVRTFCADVTRLREFFEQVTATRRATHLIVHLFAHQARTDGFPGALDELDAPDLPELRIDPFSGEDLVYEKRGWDFKLYSVAGNLQDDGGTHRPRWKQGDFVFWPLGD